MLESSLSSCCNRAYLDMAVTCKHNQLLQLGISGYGFNLYQGYLDMALTCKHNQLL